MGNYQNLMSPYFLEEAVNKYIATMNNTQQLFDSFKIYQKNKGMISLRSFSFLLRNSNLEFCNKLYEVFKSRKEGLSFNDYKIFYITFNTKHYINTIGFFSELIFGINKSLKPDDYSKTITLLFDKTPLGKLFFEDKLVISIRIRRENQKEILYSKAKFIEICQTVYQDFFKTFKFIHHIIPCSELSGNVLELMEIFNKYNFICSCGKKDKETKMNKLTEKEDNEYENMKTVFDRIEYDNRGLFNVNLLKTYFNKVGIITQLQDIIIHYLLNVTMKPYIDFVTFKSFMLECKKSPVEVCEFFLKMIFYPNKEGKKTQLEQVTVVKLIDVNDDVIKASDAVKYLDHFKGYLQNIERVNIIPFAYFGIKPITIYRFNQIIDFLMEGSTWEEFLVERIDKEKKFYALDITLWNIIEQIANDNEIPTVFDNKKIASNGFYLKETNLIYKEHFIVLPESIYIFFKKWFNIESDIQLNRITNLFNKEKHSQPNGIINANKELDVSIDPQSVNIIKDQYSYEIVLYPIHVDVYFLKNLFEEVKDKKHKFNKVTDMLSKKLQLPEKKMNNSLVFSKRTLFADIKQQFQAHEMLPIKLYLYYNNKLYQPNDDSTFIQEKINDFCLIVIDTLDKDNEQYYYNKCQNSHSSFKQQTINQSGMQNQINGKIKSESEEEKQESIIKDSTSNQIKPIIKQRDYNTPPPQIGLYNMGNTCYFNSVLQLFLNLPVLDFIFHSSKLKYFINEDNKFGHKGTFLKSYYNILLNRDREDSSSKKVMIAVDRFKQKIGSINDQFNNQNQQDANEFMIFLLETFHEELNIKASKEYLMNPPQLNNTDEEMSNLNFANSIRRGASFIDSLFLFQLKSNLTCETCSSNKITYETNYILDLPVLMETVIEIEVTLHRLPFEMKVYYDKINDDFRQYCLNHSENSLYENLKSYCNDLIETNSASSLYYLSKKNCNVPIVFLMKIERNVPFSSLANKIRLITELELEPLFKDAQMEEEECNEKSNSKFMRMSNRTLTTLVAIQYDESVCPLNRIVDDCFPTEGRRLTIYEQLNSNGILRLMFDNKLHDLDLITHYTQVNNNTRQLIDAYCKNKKSISTILSIADYLSHYRKEGVDDETFALQNIQIEYPISIYHYYILPRYSHPLFNFHHSKLAFSTQFIIVNNSLLNYNAKTLYDTIWENNKRMLKCPFKSNDELWWRTTKKDSKNDKLVLNRVCYPFILRYCYYDSQMIRCSRCPWYNFCPGCIINPYEKSTLFLSSGTSIVVDWSYTVVNEEMVQSYLRILYNYNSNAMKEEATSNKTSTLDDCFRLFCVKEKLEDKLYCDKCFSRKLFTKSYDLCKPPQILILSLKRFKYNAYSRYKISTFINYPLIDMKIKDEEYNLYGVVHHYGNIIGGHYTCTIKCGDTWMTFDDDQVYSVSEDKVLVSSAYLLVYYSKKDIENNNYYQTMLSIMSCINDNNAKKPLFKQNKLLFKGEPVTTPYGRGYCKMTIKDNSQIIPVKFIFGEGFINKNNVIKETLLQNKTNVIDDDGRDSIKETFCCLEKEDCIEEEEMINKILIKDKENIYASSIGGTCIIV